VLARDERATPFPRCGGVDSVEGRAHADGRGMTHAVRDLRRVEQRLGRHASAVQAGSAEEVLFDDDRAGAELGGAQRGGIAAAAAAEDDEVEGVVRHERIRLSGQATSPPAATKSMSARVEAPVGPLSVKP
jgi:hypothetical protein